MNIVGQVVANQFRVDAFISAGGMGAVYRVWDLERNVALAMKVLHADLAQDQVIFERFQREARALRKLKHPNIVPFYGLYQTQSLVFLLQRFIDGPTLREVLSKRAGSFFSAQDLLCIMKALCSAAGFAHSNNVIHCDIKSANIMIDQGGQIFLGDFGIARHAESDVTAMPGAGTPAYMSPEQILGKPVTRESDIYSLGVLLFELLTGQRPFRGTEKGTDRSGNTINERIRYAHLTLPAPDPRVFNANISPAVSTVVLRALEKNPAERFPSCLEFFNSLCRAFNISPGQVSDRLPVHHIPDQPQKQYPSSPVQPARTANKTPLLLVGGAAILIVILALLFTINSKPATLPMANNPPAASNTDNPAAEPADNSQQACLAQHFSTEEPRPTETHAPISSNTPTSRYTPTPTYGSCPGAEPQKVRVGDKARVCTRSDRVVVRSEADSGSEEIFRMYTGTKLEIIGGPRCGSDFTWWQVVVLKGSHVALGNNDWNTTRDEIGWVREGSDAKDLYWICPDN
ncbi:MAG: protein kinase [Chloroflexi bacterium]|nr:protein kinase [Chloroflexota bacterium]